MAGSFEMEFLTTGLAHQGAGSGDLAGMPFPETLGTLLEVAQFHLGLIHK